MNNIFNIRTFFTKKAACIHLLMKDFSALDLLQSRSAMPAFAPVYALCIIQIKVFITILLFFTVLPVFAGCGKGFSLPYRLETGAEKNTVSSYIPLIEEIVRELNAVRQAPARYAEEVIKPRLAYFERKMYKAPGCVPLLTQEGASAVKECIRVLKAASPAGKVELNEGLNRAAQWLADDQAKTGRAGHIGSDGSNLVKRIERFGTWGGSVGENCAYGLKEAREIVVQLLIDDGVRNRGHRKTILNPAFTKVGAGYSEAGKAAYGAVAVMDFAASFTAK